MPSCPLTPEYEEGYRGLLTRSREATLYATLEYRDLLADFIGCEPVYLAYVNAGRVVGALPTMLQRGSLGNVINSLPFFGSHGGFLVDCRLGPQEKLGVKKELLSAFLELAAEKECVTSTFKTSPFEPDVGFYEHDVPHRFTADRVAQVTLLPDEADGLPDALTRRFSQRPRCSIKKALRAGITVAPSRDPRHVEALQRMHAQGMAAVGAPVKPLDFFVKALRHFPDDDQCEMLCALLDGEMIAGLLYFTFRDQVEYFTPAFDDSYSGLQPNSLLIYEGMMRSIARGVRYWNFDGTLPESTSLYLFKKQQGG